MLKLMTTIQAWYATRRDDDRGATMVEYGLMVALIAVVSVLAVTQLGERVQGVFETIRDALPA